MKKELFNAVAAKGRIENIGISCLLLCRLSGLCVNILSMQFVKGTVIKASSFPAALDDAMFTR